MSLRKSGKRNPHKRREKAGKARTKNNVEKRKNREFLSKSSVNHDEIDLVVFRAILRATALDIKQTLTEDNRAIRNGILVSGLLLSLPKFAKNDTTNRAIVLESIASLKERKLISSNDHGKFQFVAALNGGYYNVTPDGRIATNFFRRNENPIEVYFKQAKAKLEIKTKTETETETETEIEVTETETETETEVTDFSGMEEYQEPARKFEDDIEYDSDSDLNTDLPEME